MTEKMIQFNALRTTSQDDDLHYLVETLGLGRCKMDRDIFDESLKIIELAEKKKDPAFRRKYREKVRISKSKKNR